MKRRRIFTYSVVGAGIDHNGFYKISLMRNDKRIVRVSPRRMAELRSTGRITDGLNTREENVT